MSHTLIVLPDDIGKPLVEAINGAKRSLRIRMFLFTDPTMLQTVLAAKHRGVDVRVMLNPARRDGTSDNDETRKALVAAKIEVRDSNPEFALTHQKSMVIDDSTGFVESLNWETRDLTETRDYAVVDHARARSPGNDGLLRGRLEPEEVPAGSEVARSSGVPTTAASGSPISSTSAKHTLWLQNERYQDTVIIERLVRADPTRREDPYPGAAAPHAQEGQADRGRRWPAHHARRRRQGAQAQGAEAARAR